MEWLNYHHLLYFWTAVKQGGVTRAAEELRLAPSTVSSQIHLLENLLGHKLFERTGRKLVLTDVGQVAFRYAEEIFSLGREFVDTLHQKRVDRPLKIRIGITDVVPKLVAAKIIEPALALDMEIRLSCHEGHFSSLLAELSIHNLDVVLSDSPIGSLAKIRGFNHLLGESAVMLFAEKSLASKFKRGFPNSLDSAPFILPAEGASLRQSLEQWFHAKKIRPQIVGEFDDNALLKAFGQLGIGFFAAPAVIRDEVMRQYHVREIGTIDGITEQFYAISVERHLKHPAVVAIAEGARSKIFS